MGWYPIWIVAHIVRSKGLARPSAAKMDSPRAAPSFRSAKIQCSQPPQHFGLDLNSGTAAVSRSFVARNDVCECETVF